MPKKTKYPETVTMVCYTAVVEEMVPMWSTWRVTGIQPSGKNKSLKQVTMAKLALGSGKGE